MKRFRPFASFESSARPIAPPFAQEMLIRNNHKIRSGHRLLQSSKPSSSAPLQRHRLRTTPLGWERTIKAESSPVMEGGGAGEKVEESAKKRNTDCVYFLVSPLTCKKGKECEYRHSDGARVNPRDCWYWLNGNCLNPKCSFRHPPLDVLIGTPRASSLPTPPSQTVSTPQILVRHSSMSHNPRKQSATCYFFQKGQCLKGDKCSFVHGSESIEPELTGIPVPHQVTMVSAAVAETPKTIKKESWGLRPSARQKISGATNEKLVNNLPLSGKSASRTECVPTNGLTLRSSYEPADVSVGIVVAETMPTSDQSQPADEHFQNDRDADEFLGESPPGFDVPIDNDIGHFDYHLEEGEFLRESLQDGRTPYSDSEFAANPGRVMLKGKDDYRHSGREDRQYGREQQRTSSERNKEMSGKRVRRRVECPDEIDRADLRYRLLKQKRLHGPRSVVHLDGHCVPSWRDNRGQASCRKDRCLEAEKFCGHHSSKDQQHFVPKSSSTRLQGRIKFPGRNSHDQSVDRSERQQDRERHRSGLSPTRPTLNQEGHSDRLKRKLSDDFSADARSIGRHPVRRLNSDHLNFAGPKSLAELKGAKVLDTSQGQSNKSINSRLSLEKTSPIPPNDMLNSESMSPPEDTELCSDGNAIDDALGKKVLVLEGGVDGQSPVKDLVQMECDVTNAVEDRENPEQNEESEEVYEDDVQRIEEEERENLEQTEEISEVYEDDVQWTEDEEGETPNDLKAEEDAYEESAAEFSDDDDDFARKVALLFS